MDPVIRFSTDDWQRFLDEVAGAGSSGSNGVVELDFQDDGDVWFRSTASETVLRFSAEEYAAFREGVLLGEFKDADSHVVDK